MKKAYFTTLHKLLCMKKHEYIEVHFLNGIWKINHMHELCILLIHRGETGKYYSMVGDREYNSEALG